MHHRGDTSGDEAAAAAAAAAAAGGGAAGGGGGGGGGHSKYLDDKTGIHPLHLQIAAFLLIPRSGIRYNRGGCTLRHCGEPLSDQNLRLGLDDPGLEILHFMGAALSLLCLHHYLCFAVA